MASEDALDLLRKMFTYDPNLRISAQQALEHRYFTSRPPPTEAALLPRHPPKSKALDFNPQAGPTVLSPLSKLRRVMPQCNRIDGNAYHNGKAEDQFRPQTGDRSGVVPMSIDFSVFGTRSPSRPTINSADRTHLKRKLDLEFQPEEEEEEE